MAGYQPQQRLYNGPAARRPTPQQYGSGPGQYDGYQDEYGYGGQGQYGDGYGQDYGGQAGQYDDMSYGGGAPPPQGYPQRDYYGPGRGGPPPMRGRGGPIQRPGTADGVRRPYPPGGPGGRGGPGMGPPPPGRGGYGPPPNGGGRPAPLERPNFSDPNGNRGPPLNPPMSSPNEVGFGSPFPAFPGSQRKTDLEQEQQILDKMSGMDISARQPNPGSIGRQDSGRSMASADGYGPGPMGGRGPPPRGYPQGPPGPGPHRGPPPREYGGYGDNGYGQGQMGPPPLRGGGFDGPNRSMTMPANDQMGPRHGLQRTNTAMSYDGPMGQQVPPRPSTAQGGRPMPTRSHTTASQGSYQGPEYGSPDQQWQQQQPPLPPQGQGPPGPPGPPHGDGMTSFGEFYDAYFESARTSTASEYQRNNIRQSQASDIPDFDAAPASRPRASLDQHMMSPTSEQHHSGPSRVPEVTRTKSHPNLRQPQAAVFEMAQDLPPIPGPPNPNDYNQGYNDPYGNDQYGPAQGYNQQPPPGPGLPSGPGSMRSKGPGGAHPMPIRPGLMPNSVVSQVGDRPPPMRNYNNGPPPQQQPQQQQQMMNQQGPPMQQGSPPNSAPKASGEPPVTPEELEKLRSIIKADPNDQKSALRLAKRLVEASEVLVPNVADPKTRQRSRDRYVTDAYKILKKLVNAQNPDAMFFLADCLGRGALNGEPDNKEAFTLYQSAAKLGHGPAAYRTAVCCEIGHEDGGGTRKDPLKAFQWYKRAATLGDTPAMYKVGIIMLKGLLGQPKNPREAVSWLKRAADRADADNPHALHELGLLYESAEPDDVILRDEAYAFTLFKQAAELGYKFSQFRLGATYEFGLMGCPIDPRLSIMWYSRAATQEEHQSELALSGWYLTGSEGILAQNDTEAYLWARKAAMAGLAKAEFAMGYFTEVGIGVPANLEDAKRWYWRSAAQDFPKARERLEELKRSGKNGVRPRERITRSKIGRQQENECAVM